MSMGMAGAASGTSLPRSSAGMTPVDASPQNTRCVIPSTWRATGRRSRSYESSSAPLSACEAANASFQPRFAASWMATFIPWPVAGE